jgi:hypothetical protein
MSRVEFSQMQKNLQAGFRQSEANIDLRAHSTWNVGMKEYGLLAKFF